MLIINDVIASYKSCQIKSFTWCIKSHCTLLCIFRHTLGWNMLMSGCNNIRPDFIRDNHYVMLFVDFHCLFNLPTFPNTTTWVMRRTEDCCMDLILYDLLFHIIKVHTPYAVFIFYQVAVDNVISIIGQAVCKTNVSRFM